MEDVYKRLLSLEIVLRVVHRNEERSCKGEKRSEAGKDVLPCEMCVYTHLGPHEFFKGTNVLLGCSFIDHLGYLFILLLHLFANQAYQNVDQEECFSHKVRGCRDHPRRSLRSMF